MSDCYNPIILPEAQQDIRNIVIYIAQELFSPQAALNLQDAFQEAIQKLSYMPTRIKPIDEEPWGSQGVRKIRVKNYYIYFIVDENEMAVKVNAVIGHHIYQELFITSIYLRASKIFQNLH